MFHCNSTPFPKRSSFNSLKTLSTQRLHCRDGFVHGGPDGRAEPHKSFVSAQRLGLASYQQNALQLASHGGCHAQHIHRDSCSCPLHRAANCPGRGIQFREIRLDHINGARRCAARAGVHQDSDVGTVHQRVCQVEAPDAEVDDTHAFGIRPGRPCASRIPRQTRRRQGRYCRFPRSECRVSRMLVPQCSGSTSSRGKKKTMPGLLLQFPDRGPGSSSTTTASLKLTFVVLLDPLNGRDHSRKSQIENIAALPRTQAHAIAGLYFYPANVQALDRSLVFEKLPLPTRSLSHPRINGLFGCERAGQQPDGPRKTWSVLRDSPQRDAAQPDGPQKRWPIVREDAEGPRFAANIITDSPGYRSDVVRAALRGVLATALPASTRFVRGSAASALIRLTHLALLLFGQGQNAQR